MSIADKLFLSQYATIQSLPDLRSILTRLLFGPPHSSSSGSSSPLSSASPSPPSGDLVPTSPSERYALLPPGDKIALVTFLCDMCMSSKVVRAHIDYADAALTDLRKEKIEVNRERKRLYVSLLPDIGFKVNVLLQA